MLEQLQKYIGRQCYWKKNNAVLLIKYFDMREKGLLIALEDNEGEVYKFMVELASWLGDDLNIPKSYMESYKDYVTNYPDGEKNLFFDTDVQEAILYQLTENERKEEETKRQEKIQRGEILLDKINKTVYEQHGHSFEGFLHYTTLDNLYKILSSGKLKSRFMLDNESVSYYDSAEANVIAGTRESVKKSARLLYYYNSPITFRFETNNPLRDYVILVFDKDIVKELNISYWEKSAYYYATAKNTTDPACAAAIFDFNRIFERGWYDKNEYSNYDKSPYRDAEVLCLDGYIDLKHLVAVYFKKEEALEGAKRLLAGSGYTQLFKLDKARRRFVY